MRKQILTSQTATAAPFAGELDLAILATVAVTSEASDHPVENAFDHRRGPGGSRWIAAAPGEQTLILAFDAPQSIRHIALEIEETQNHRTQELHLAVSHDGGITFHELLRQEFNFSPASTTFERENWAVAVDQVTHLRLGIVPDKGGGQCLASLTALALRQGYPP
ncbi:MAG: hypothetical protein KJ072_02710 [Verrucomicrobia bacterium]|nr:hypothetical protein [Verrucomicrobiota bacterium]